MKLYGIPNCDTVKKACKALDANNVPYVFIDVKAVSLDGKQIQKWLAQYPDKLINKRSTTYRTHKTEWLACSTETQKIAFLCTHPTIIKRPVIEHNDGSVTVGWPIP